MKRIITLLTLLVSFHAQAQVSAYQRTVLSGQTYTQITGGTVINTTGGLSTSMGNNADDGAVLVTLPFTFTYDGNTFTEATFCTNGWVGLGNQLTVSSANGRTSANLFSGTVPNNTIAAWFGDMSANFPAPTGIGSMVHGTYGTGVYAFEWRNATGSGFGLTTTNLINFMILLYGPTSSAPGRIELLYGSQSGALTTGRSIGLENATGGNFHNALNGSSSLTTTASAWPGNGTGYRFDPPCPATVTSQPTNVTICPGDNTSFNITASGATTTYQWQENTGSGFVNLANGGVYSGVNTASLSMTAVPGTLANAQYRCMVGNGTCNSFSNVATLLMNISTIVSTTPATICSGGTATLGATASGSGTVTWHTAAIGGTTLATGSSLTISGATSTTTYFAQATTAGSGSVPGSHTIATATSNGQAGFMYDFKPLTNMTFNSYDFVPGTTGTMTVQIYYKLGTHVGFETNSGAWILIGTANNVTATLNVPINVAFSTPPALIGGQTYALYVATNPNSTVRYWNGTTFGALWSSNADVETYTGKGVSSLFGSGFFSPRMGAGTLYYTKGGGCTTGTSARVGVTLTVQNGPVIVTHPTSIAGGCQGGNASFSVSATGPGLIYQWQVNQGAGFINLSNGGGYSGVTTTTLNITNVGFVLNGYQYRCEVSGTCPPSAISNPATLNVNPSTIVTANPAHITVCNGLPASFTVGANATSPTYQWQVYDNTGYYNLSNTGVYSGVNTTTLNISAVNPGMSTYQYRCVVTGTCAPLTVISGNGILTVGSNIPVTAQPQNTTVCAGSTGTFSVTAASSGVIYQWQVNTGSGYANVSNGANYSGATTTSLSVLNTPIGFNGYQYRCVISNSCVAPFFSNAATLSVQTAPTITTQPVNTTSCDFQNTGFSIAATGTGLSYQWQVDAGLGFVNIGPSAPYSGSTSTTLGISSVNSSFNGYIYRCIVTGTCTPALTSNAVTLTITNRPVITAAPTTQVVCEGSSTSYSVTATGTSIGYQWQMNSGSGYTNLTNGGVYSGVTTATLNLASIPNSLHSRAYRCVVTGSCAPPAMTGDAMLFVNSAPVVTSQPIAKDVCIGGTTNFYTLGAAVSGAAPLGYQWQVNTGTGFTNLVNGAPYGGVTTNNLVITGATAGLNGYTYRCVINNGTCFTINTDAAPLTINTLPSITLQPLTQNPCLGSDATFRIRATGTAVGYQWQVNTGSGFQNIPDNSLPLYDGPTDSVLVVNSVPAGMNGYTYRCIVRGVCNPPVTSAVVSLNVLNPVTINNHTVTDTICEGSTSKLGVRVTGSAVIYHWQLKTSGGYVNLTNNPPYSGVNTDSLRISAAPNSLHGNVYRCAITETVQCNLWYYTGDIPVGIRTAPSTLPAVLTTHLFKAATFTVPPTGTFYQWQEDDNSGAGFRNLNDGTPYAGVYTNTLKVDPLKLSMSGHRYRCIVDGVCASAVATKPATLVIDPTLSVNNVQTGVDISIYPNPLAGSELYINFGKKMTGITEIKVLDKLGKVVYTESLNDNTTTSVLKLHQLAAGIYMVQIANKDQNINVTKQFVKQ